MFSPFLSPCVLIVHCWERHGLPHRIQIDNGLEGGDAQLSIVAHLGREPCNLFKARASTSSLGVSSRERLSRPPPPPTAETVVLNSKLKREFSRVRAGTSPSVKRISRARGGGKVHRVANTKLRRRGRGGRGLCRVVADERDWILPLQVPGAHLPKSKPRLSAAANSYLKEATGAP